MHRTWYRLLAKHNTILILFLSGLFVRFLVMPWAMHADLLSMSYRAHLITEYSIWQLPTNQYLAHLIYALNLAFLKIIYTDLTSYFPSQFGLSLGSLTASVGDWLTFNENPRINELLFFLKIPHLIADTATFFLLAYVFRKKIKQQYIVLMLWWFNPVNIYAFYIFARHDAFTALAVLVAMLLVVRNKILPALIALFAAFEIRVMPLLFLPFFLIESWKYRKNSLWLLKQVAMSMLIIIGYTVITKMLPTNTDVLDQLIGQPPPDLSGMGVGVPVRIIDQLSNMLIGSAGIYLFIFLSMLLLFMFFITKVQDSGRFEQLNAVLLIVMAAYFIFLPFSPHYFVWLSLFAAVSIGYSLRLLLPYTIAVLGWLIMGAFASDSFAINQNLFTPISTALFRTPQLYMIVAERGMDAQLLFNFGQAWLRIGLLILICMVWWYQLRTRVKIPHIRYKNRSLVMIGVAIAAGFLLVRPRTAEALTAPVTKVDQHQDFIELLPGKTIGQTFEVPTGSFGAIEVRIQTDRVIGSQNLIVRLKEFDKDEWIYQAEYDRNDFYNKYFYPFGFPLISDTSNKTYYLELSTVSTNSALPIKIGIANTNPYTNGELIINGNTMNDYDMNFSVLVDDNQLFKLQLLETLEYKMQAQKTFFAGYAVLLGLNVLAIGFMFAIRWHDNLRKRTN